MTTHYSVITESVCLEQSWKQDHLKSSVPNEHLWQTAAGRSRTFLSEVTRQETWNEATVTGEQELNFNIRQFQHGAEQSVQSSGCNKEKSLKIKSGLEYFMHHPACCSFWLRPGPTESSHSQSCKYVFTQTRENGNKWPRTAESLTADHHSEQIVHIYLTGTDAVSASFWVS